MITVTKIIVALAGFGIGLAAPVTLDTTATEPIVTVTGSAGVIADH